MDLDQTPNSGRWLALAVAAMTLMVTVGLAVVWWRGTQEAVGPPVLGTLPAFELTSSRGEPVSSASLAGAPWVADFVFTRCAVSCPLMTERMAALEPRLPPAVGRVSFTVDPEHDTPEVLARYAATYRAPPEWHFLTGSREELWELSIQGFKLGVVASDPTDPRAAAEPITHSTRFVLVDGEGQIRGYYDAFDPADTDRLVADAVRLAGRP